MDFQSHDISSDPRYVVKPLYKAMQVLKIVCETPTQSGERERLHAPLVHHIVVVFVALLIIRLLFLLFLVRF